MNSFKKMLGLLMVAVLLLGLCACNSGGDDNQKTDDGIDGVPVIPEVVFGIWHPSPEVSDVPIEINSDGTCVINGESQHWTMKTVEKEAVTLTVGEGEEAVDIKFSHLTTNVPILVEKYCGWSVKQSELWDYTGNWRNEETGKTFTLDLFALKEAGCKISLETGMMTVEVPDDDTITHTLKITAEQCVVTDAAGNSTIYVPSDEVM